MSAGLRCDGDPARDPFLNDCVALLIRWGGLATTGALVDEINRLRKELARAEEIIEDARQNSMDRDLVDP